MPYKDKEQANACWRRRNAKPERKAYMGEYAKERMANPEPRKRAYAAQKKWQAKPENKVLRAAYMRQRRKDGKVSKESRAREKIRKANTFVILAGRPKPDRCELCAGLPGRKGMMFDHDHQRGHFRGWICTLCNLGLGAARDDVQILRKWIAYLERNRENTAPQLALAGI